MTSQYDRGERDHVYNGASKDLTQRSAEENLRKIEALTAEAQTAQRKPEART